MQDERRDRVLRNERTGKVLGRHVVRAANMLERIVGLLPRPYVAMDEGLWIEPCASVHTLGMRATLDLYFLDREGRVLKIAAGVKPGQLSASCRGARTVLELGATAHRDVAIGDRLVLG